MGKEINELSNEELLYAAKYNLPLFANQYSDIERVALKGKVSEFAIQRKVMYYNRKRKVLFG